MNANLKHEQTTFLDTGAEANIKAPVSASFSPETGGEAALVMAQKSNIAESNKVYLDYNKYNPIFFTQVVLDYLPKGVEMVPHLLEIPERDIWTKAKAGFLKTGDVMLSAAAITRIAQAAGVTLKRVTDEVVTMNGVTILRLEYEATMMMPDGSIIQEIGGKEEPYTPGQGHSREKTDTKARRNALRRLLGIPVTMSEADIKKPMVIWKAVFRKGGDIDHIVDAIETGKRKAIATLYGSTVDDVIDVPSEVLNKDGELTIDGIKTRIDSAQSILELNEIKKALSENKPADEHRALIGSWLIGREYELNKVKL